MNTRTSPGLTAKRAPRSAAAAVGVSATATSSPEAMAVSLVGADIYDLRSLNTLRVDRPTGPHGSQWGGTPRFGRRCVMGASPHGVDRGPVGGPAPTRARARVGGAAGGDRPPGSRTGLDGPGRGPGRDREDAPAGRGGRPE